MLIASTAFFNPPPRADDTAIASTMSGIELRTSMNRMMTASTFPP